MDTLTEQLAHDICSTIISTDGDLQALYMLLYNHYSKQTDLAFRDKLWQLLEKYVKYKRYENSYNFKQDISDFIVISELYSVIKSLA